MKIRKKGKRRERSWVTLSAAALVFFAGAGLNSLRAELTQKAGFIELGALDFHFHQGSYFNRLQLRSSPARIWYVFQPADESPAEKPLFVFFNGGPGGATSAGLFSANTGRKAVKVDNEKDTAEIINNPSSWTAMGNLLHIDARTAGFSYSLMENPGSDPLRIA